MERKIGDIKDKKLKAENITLAAIYNILFTNDIVCSLIVEMLSELRKSRLCRFRVKQQGNKLEQIASFGTVFQAKANQWLEGWVMKIGELIWQICVYLLFFIKETFAGILIVTGPITFGLSVLPSKLSIPKNTSWRCFCFNFLNAGSAII
jgi:hypothetical protein